jgi:hypothetical protein
MEIGGSAVAGPPFFLLWWNGVFAGGFGEMVGLVVVLLW